MDNYRMKQNGCRNTMQPCMKVPCSIYHDIDQLPLAMAYVPWQQFHTIFDLCEAFKAGTAFPELYKPFNPKGGMCK